MIAARRDRWERVKDVLSGAVAVSPEGREAFLARACGDDDGLRREVSDLLRFSRDDDFLRAPIAPFEPFESHGTGESGGSGGRVLGEFELLREIGRGGMGVVYLARQVPLDRLVAVKVLPNHLTASLRQVERFQREAQAAARLQHPGITQVHAADRAGNTRFIAMEYVPGRDLQREIALLKQGPGALAADGEPPVFPAFIARDYVRAAVRLAMDVADALQHAHECGVVHRDVKPSNLLLQVASIFERAGARRPIRVRVVDFGVARDLRDAGGAPGAGTFAGTPNYMSPEQVRADDEGIDARTDVYSLGVVLYELLTLQRPFDARSGRDVMERILLHEPAQVRRLNARVPRDLATICAKAMAKDPADRYESARAFRDDLERFLNHEAPLATPPSFRKRARQLVRAHRRTIGAALLAAAMLGAGAWLALRGADERARDAAFAALPEPRAIDALPAGTLAECVASLPELQRAEAALAGVRAVHARAVAGVPGDHDATDARARRLAELRAAIERRAGDMLRVAAASVGEVSAASERDVLALDVDALGRAAVVLHGVLPLLPDEGTEAAHPFSRGFLPLLAVETTPGALVTLMRLDPVTGLPAESAAPLELGRAPVGDVALEPGLWRVRVADSAGGTGETTVLAVGLGRRFTTPRIVPRAADEAERDMVLVRGGPFRFEGPGGAADARFAETRSPAAVPSFWMDLHEVTNAEYRQFVVAESAPPPDRWPADWRTHWDPAWDALPVTFVSAAQAEAYAAWAGKRLPGVFEWQYAARGPEGWSLPWSATDRLDGADPEALAIAHVGRPAESAGSLFQAYLAGARPCGSHPGDRASCGVLDLLGSVREWTSTPSRHTEGDGVWRVQPAMRWVGGASWSVRPSPATPLDLARLGSTPSMAQSTELGFRCVRGVAGP